MSRVQSLSPPRKYTPADDDVIRKMWTEGQTSTAIGAALVPPATAPAIRVRARRLGLPMRKPSYAVVGDYDRIDGGCKREYVPSAVPPRNKPEQKPKAAVPAEPGPRRGNNGKFRSAFSETRLPDEEKLEAMRRKAVVRRRLEDVAEDRASQQAPATGIRCWCGKPGAPVVCEEHKRKLAVVGAK